MPGRIIGFYALTVMDSEGPLYGYRLSDRIAERTEGAWRPGAGAVYPALDSLAQRKFARVSSEGRRRVYRITPQGRAHLREVRRNMAWRNRTVPDLIQLWAEITGPGDPGQFLVESVHRRLDSVLAYLGREREGPTRNRALRAQLRLELERALARLDEGTDPTGAGSRRAARRGRTS